MGVLLAGSWTARATPPPDVLTARTRAAVLQTRTAGVRRLAWMRFFLPTDRLREEPGLWERWFSSKFEHQHERALAFYLFNMYVSTNLYQEPDPQTLSLNYIGVLDGFEMAQEPFDFARASSFYQKHKEPVLTQFNNYLQARAHPWPKPTAADLARWVERLQSLPRQHQRAVYTFAQDVRLEVALPDTSYERLSVPLQTARTQAARQVILYDEPDLKLEDFDSKVGPHKARRKRTYRPVKDECFYASYLVARRLVQTFLQSPQTWRSSHVYLLTATPRQGDFLTPASGSRFVLANGQTGLHWRYHTAVFVIAEQNGRFYPFVLDSFLAGHTPVSMGEWLGHFSPQTVFRARPFVRQTAVENAMVTPEVTDGKIVWVDGQAYHPAPVLE